jgi:hypothetical protein
MEVWSAVVLLLKGELSSLSLCLLVCNLVVYCVVVLLVVMEWTAAITGDHVELLLDILPKRKILDFPWRKQMLIKIRCLQLKSRDLRVVEFRQHPHLGLD